MNNLKAARKAKRMTQVEVARHIGLAQSSYSAWEKGTTKIDHTSLLKLSELFDVTVDYLLGNDSGKKEISAGESPNGDIPGYDDLNEANKAIIDSLIDQLLAAQYGQE